MPFLYLTRTRLWRKAPARGFKGAGTAPLQKKNHFRDWLAKSQGKENTTIPEVVYDSLMQELKKKRIRRVEDVTREMIRGLLKKLRMSKYYHNLSQIHYHITGLRPPRFTPEEEATLMDMFMELGKPDPRPKAPNP